MIYLACECCVNINLTFREYLTTTHGLAEIQNLGIADFTQFTRQCSRLYLWSLGPVCHQSVKIAGDIRFTWLGKLQPELEPPPDGAVQQFGMIAGGNGDDIAWQLVELHQHEGDDALDFACLMGVTTLFADNVEFIEEQHTGDGLDVIEQGSEAGIRLTKVTADQNIVANNVKWQAQSLRYAFSE